MVEKFDLYYDPAGEMRTIHLYLPEGYATSGERYPVLYMFDGHNLFFDSDATYGKSWGLREFLDGWGRKLIVVGVECSHHGNDRLVEYCPYRVKSGFAGEICGEGEKTMEWMVGTLKPYIDAHYPTWPFREGTAVAGSSMGGMMALYAVLRYNRWFSKAAAISPAISFAMPQFRREIETCDGFADTRIFFSWGTREFGGSDAAMKKRIAELETRIRARGMQTATLRQLGGTHSEASWEQQVPTWMAFLWA